MILLPIPPPGKGWIFRCELRENPIARRAGFFKFDSELNAWTTRRARVAINLAAYADDDLRAEILTRAESEHDTDNYIYLERDGAGVYRYYSDIRANHCAQANNFRFASEPEAHWWTMDRISAIACYADAVKYQQFRCASELQEDLRESATRLNEAITESRALSADIVIPHPEGLDYKPFQYAGIRYGLNCFAEGRGVLFGDEMRLGKTIQAIGLNNAMPEIVSVLVIARATLKINWQRELETWLVHPRTIGLTTTKEVPEVDVVIANYEQLGKMVKTDAAIAEEKALAEAKRAVENLTATDEQTELVAIATGLKKPDKKKRKAKKTRPQLRPGIDKLWDLVIIDEFHRASNIRAQRTQLFLAVRSKYIAALSGTPLPNGRPKEAWPILHRLDPGTFKDYWNYSKRYCDGFDGRWGWEDNGASNLDEWWMKVRSSCFDGATEIYSEHGRIRIDQLVHGRIPARVWTQDGMGRLSLQPVVGFSERPYRGLLIKIRFAEGEIVCTPDHRIFTDQGESRAGQIVTGDYLCSVQETENPSTEKVRSESPDDGKPDILLSILRGQKPTCGTSKGLCGDSEQPTANVNEGLRGMSPVFCGSEQADLSSPKILHVQLSSENDLCPLSDGAQGSQYHRNITTCRQAGSVSSRESGSASTPSRKSVPALELGETERYRTPGVGNGSQSILGIPRLPSHDRRETDLCRHNAERGSLNHRSRRSGSREASEPAERQATGRRSVLTRVLSVEILGVGDRGDSPGRSQPDYFVYDIEVERNHNYFANGILVHNCMVRRLRSEVRAELPPKQRQIIELPQEFDGDGLTLFPQVQTLVDDYYARLAAAKTVDSTTAYAELVAELSEPEKVAFEDTADARHKSAIAKLPLAFKHIEDLLLEEPKVIVFAFHVDVIQMTAAYFNTAAVANYGEMDIFEQQAARDRFNTDPECKVIVCQIEGAEGYDLSVANVEVFLEEVWAPYKASQAEDRAVSMDKLDCILVQHLVQEGSIDCTMARITVEKQDRADQALDRETLAIPEVRVGAEEPVPSPVSLPARQEAIEPPLPVRPAERQGQPTQTRAAQLAAAGLGLTPEQIALVHLGLRKLAGLCDGALAHDKAGFSSFDATVGHSLASREKLSAAQGALGKSLLKKYVGQLSRAGLEISSLYE